MIQIPTPHRTFTGGPWHGLPRTVKHCSVNCKKQMLGSRTPKTLSLSSGRSVMLPNFCLPMRLFPILPPFPVPTRGFFPKKTLCGFRQAILGILETLILRSPVFPPHHGPLIPNPNTRLAPPPWVGVCTPQSPSSVRFSSVGRSSWVHSYFWGNF